MRTPYPRARKGVSSGALEAVFGHVDSMRWLRRPRDRTRTRVWVVVSARRVDPLALLIDAAKTARLSTMEQIAFDGASAAIELKLRLAEPRHEPGTSLSIDATARERIGELLQAIHADATVQDVVLESHVAGEDDASTQQFLEFPELLQLITDDQLHAGTRYVSD
jgi:hypothetical protein